MKKQTKTILWTILILAILGGSVFVLFKAGIFQGQGLGYIPTPVFCNQYSFTCCSEKQNQSSFSSGYFSQCPTTANKCKITSITSSTTSSTTYGGSPSISIYAGTSNCIMRKTLFFINYFACDDGRQVNVGSEIAKGSYLYVQSGTLGNVNYDVSIPDLIFCGRSGCTIGSPVQGADGCTFQTDKGIYSESGSVIKQPNAGTTSYTVPSGQCVLSYQTGDRIQCGYVEEQCSSDSECMGHTYGNKECLGRTLQTYGCRQLGLPSGITQTGSELFSNKLATQESTSTNLGTKSRCEIISANTVQCCGDTDCGSGAVCDPTTFTCKAPSQVQCRQDYDCGVSTQCNFATKKLVKPTCTLLGKCEQKEIQDVGCCSDTDCSTGWYCDTDYKCKEQVVQRTACPFECCPAESSTDKAKYFDRACPDGRTCLKGNVCSSASLPNGECPVATWNPTTWIANWNCKIKAFFTEVVNIVVGILATIMGIITAGMFITAKKPKNTGLKVLLGIVLGIGIASLIFWLKWFILIISIVALAIWIIWRKVA